MTNSRRPRKDDQASSCVGKKTYTSLHQANGVIRWMHRYKGVEEPMRPYFCKFCHKVHIGNNFEHD